MASDQILVAREHRSRCRIRNEDLEFWFNVCPDCGRCLTKRAWARRYPWKTYGLALLVLTYGVVFVLRDIIVLPLQAFTAYFQDPGGLGAVILLVIILVGWLLLYIAIPFVIAMVLWFGIQTYFTRNLRFGVWEFDSTPWTADSHRANLRAREEIQQYQKDLLAEEQMEKWKSRMQEREQERSDPFKGWREHPYSRNDFADYEQMRILEKRIDDD